MVALVRLFFLVTCLLNSYDVSAQISSLCNGGGSCDVSLNGHNITVDLRPPTPVLVDNPIFSHAAPNYLVWFSNNTGNVSSYFYILNIRREMVGSVNGCSIFKINENVGGVIYINGNCFRNGAGADIGFGDLHYIRNITSVLRGVEASIVVKPVITNNNFVGNITIEPNIELFQLGAVVSNDLVPEESKMLDKKVSFKTSKVTLTMNKLPYCNVFPETQTVNLPTVNVKNLDSASELGATAFSLTLTCTGSVDASISYADVNNPMAQSNTGILQPASTGTLPYASGVGVLVSDENGNALDFSANKKTKVLSGESTKTLKFEAKYKKTGKISPGLVNASMTYTLMYD